MTLKHRSHLPQQEGGCCVARQHGGMALWKCVVALRRVRLVHGWVTVIGRVSHLVASHLGQLSLLPSVGWQNEYQLAA